MIRREADSPGDFIRGPQAALRIGITGARKLDETALPGLRRRLRDVLAAMRTAYSEPVLLRMISPLAEGADRLAATAALELGYRLEAPLPFSAAEYALDFPETIAEFRTLLAAAAPHVLALDGGRGEVETESYEAVGRLVVRNCDLLVAVWDGGESRGRGGTAEIVQFAAGYGLPIWWIPADGASPAGWLRGDAASSRLQDYLRQLIVDATPLSMDSAVADPLLAEALHAQQMLAALGWSLPAAQAGTPAGRYFNAMRRAAPLPQGDFGSVMLTRLRADARTWLEEQMGDRDPLLEQMRLDVPLASQALGARILALAEARLRKLDGWASLFPARAGNAA